MAEGGLACAVHLDPWQHWDLEQRSLWRRGREGEGVGVGEGEGEGEDEAEAEAQCPESSRSHALWQSTGQKRRPKRRAVHVAVGWRVC